MCLKNITRKSPHIMHNIFRKKVDLEIINKINRAVDEASTIDSFEILIPPQSVRILTPFKDQLRSQCPEVNWNDKTYVVIRTVTEKGNQASQGWHFDNLKETALIVLKSAEGEENGDLLIRPDLRKSYDSIFMYTLTKVFWTNPIVWFILRIKKIRNRFFTRITLKPGDVMIFNGSTTYHGNLPVSSGMRRTILLHNDQLFADSWVTKLFHKLNKLYLYKK